MSIQPTDGQQAATIQPADGQQLATHPANGQPATVRPRLAAIPHAEQQGAPARLRRFLGRLLRGHRIRERLALLALAIEQHLIGGTRTPDTTSYTENVILGIGKAAGDRILARFHRILSRLAKRADHLRAAQQGMRIRARYQDTVIVRHPDGGVRTIAQTAATRTCSARRSKQTGPAARSGTGGSPPPCAGSRCWFSVPTGYYCCTSSPA